MVYVFPDGLYDPTTFKASTLGSIETLGGKKVTGIGTGSYYKNGGYCKFECEPGNYYVVGVYLGKSSWGGIPHQTWKGVNAPAVFASVRQLVHCFSAMKILVLKKK